jgi:hypothetical protein
MVNDYTYSIGGLFNKVQALSLFREDGRNKEFDNISISLDERVFVISLLEMACSEVFELIHSLSPVTEDDDENAVGDYVFDIDEDSVEFPLRFPSNFNVKLVPVIGNKIQDCIVKKTYGKWLDAKGRESDRVDLLVLQSTVALKRSINHRTSMSLTYRMY